MTGRMSVGYQRALLPFIGYPRTLNGLAAVNATAPAAREG